MIGILIVGDGLLGNMLLVGYRDLLKSESVGWGKLVGQVWLCQVWLVLFFGGIMIYYYCCIVVPCNVDLILYFPHAIQLCHLKTLTDFPLATNF